MLWKYCGDKFASKVKTGISSRKSSYRHTANKLSMSHMTLYRIALGIIEPTMTQFMTLCDYFDLCPLEFFDDFDLTEY